MKNILLSGVSRGLGYDITIKLLAEGYVVYGISRSITTQVQKLINDEKNFHFINYDLQEWKGLKESIFDAFINQGVQIHGLIHNAASAYDDIISNIDEERLLKMFEVNVFSGMMLTKYAIRNMILHDVKGSLVHISSISTHTGYKGLSMYAATKGSLEAFSKNTAREWGPKGIRSNCVVPGFMETDMSAGLTDEQKQRIYNRTSLKKPVNINSVSDTVSFLISEKSSSITGQNFLVDCGTI